MPSARLEASPRPPPYVNEVLDRLVARIIVEKE